MLVTRNFSDKWVSFLREKFEVTLWEKDSVADREWILSELEGKNGALVMLTDLVDTRFLDSSDRLMGVSTLSVGYDHIDVPYARKKGIIVANTPDVLTDSTADLGMALLLSTARRVVEGDRTVRKKEWKGDWSPHFMLGQEVSGKTIGIFGMGRIGRAVARRAAAFGMNIIYNSRQEKSIPDASFVDRDELLRSSDFLMVTLSLNSETTGIMDSKALSLMKSGSILVNISRGKIVDEDALYKALKDGKIAGAGLDVYQEEPLSPTSPLLSLTNIVLSPHLGSATVETREKMAELATLNLVDILEGRKPKYSV